jgi:hypothetical protein
VHCHQGRTAQAPGAPIWSLGALDATYGATGFNVCPVEFWSCYGMIPPWYFSNPPFGIGMLTLCHCFSEICKFLFSFSRGSQLRTCLECQRDFGLRHLSNARTVKTVELYVDGLNTFFIVW